MNKYSVLWEVKSSFNKVYSGIKTVLAPTKERAQLNVFNDLENNFPEIHKSNILIGEITKLNNFIKL